MAKKKRSLFINFLLLVIVAIIIYGLIYYLPKLQDYQKNLSVRKELEIKINSLQTEIENLKNKISQQEDAIKQLETEKADLQIKLKILEETKKTKQETKRK